MENPRCPSFTAVARPIPLAAPVTIATRPFPSLPLTVAEVRPDLVQPALNCSGRRAWLAAIPVPAHLVAEDRALVPLVGSVGQAQRALARVELRQREVVGD